MLKRDVRDGTHMGERTFSLWVYIFLAIALLVVVVMIVRPSIMGYSVYQKVVASNYSLEDYANSINDLKGNLAVARVNSSLYAEQLSHVEKLHSDVSSAFQACSEERAQLRVGLNSSVTIHSEQVLRLQSDIDSLNEKVVESENLRKKEVSDLTAQKDAIVRQMTTERDVVVTQLNDVCELKIGNTARDLEELRSEYDLLVANTARSICCKERIDDVSINSYDVLNHRVVCLSGGEKRLEC